MISGGFKKGFDGSQTHQKRLSHTQGSFRKGDTKKTVPVVPILVGGVSRTPVDISGQRSILAKCLHPSGCDPTVCGMSPI